MKLGGAYVILWAIQAKVFRADFISSTLLSPTLMKDAWTMLLVCLLVPIKVSDAAMSAEEWPVNVFETG